MTDFELLEKYGWEVECESPLEIRHSDGSFATLNAAKYVIGCLWDEEKEVSEEAYGAVGMQEKSILQDGNIAYLQRAMQLLYKTSIEDWEQAKNRGEAIQAIDKIIVFMGEESYIPIMER